MCDGGDRSDNVEDRETVAHQEDCAMMQGKYLGPGLGEETREWERGAGLEIDPEGGIPDSNEQPRDEWSWGWGVGVGGVGTQAESRLRAEEVPPSVTGNRKMAGLGLGATMRPRRPREKHQK